MASCARRNFAALTIFMAFVICCILCTELIRFLTSFNWPAILLSWFSGRKSTPKTPIFNEGFSNSYGCGKDGGCRMLDTGCWMLDAGCWMLDAGCWMLDAGCWMLDAGCW